MTVPVTDLAGPAARQAFEPWNGIPTQALPALEPARYELESRLPVEPSRAERR